MCNNCQSSSPNNSINPVQIVLHEGVNSRQCVTTISPRNHTDLLPSPRVEIMYQQSAPRIPLKNQGTLRLHIQDDDIFNVTPPQFKQNSQNDINLFHEFSDKFNFSSFHVKFCKTIDVKKLTNLLRYYDFVSQNYVSFQRRNAVVFLNGYFK